MKSVALNKLFMANIYELYTTICWNISENIFFNCKIY